MTTLTRRPATSGKPASGPHDVQHDLPHTLEREPFGRLILGACLGSMAMMFAAAFVLKGLPRNAAGWMSMLSLACWILGVIAVLCVPTLLHRVVLERDGVSLRTWKGTRRLPYCELRLVSLHLQRFETNYSQGHTTKMVLEREPGDPDAMQLSLDLVKPGDRLLLARVLKQQAEQACFDDLSSVLLEDLPNS